MNARPLLASLAFVAGCSTAATTSSIPPANAATTAAGSPSGAPASPCASPEASQFDFWVGDWDVVIRARSSADSNEWTESRGTNHVERVLSGCAVEERFHAEGPGAPWNGHSASVYVPAQKAWRQTWVDDSGGFISTRGTFEGGALTLLGEPRDRGGKPVQMRMIYRDVTANGFLWQWQQGAPGATEWSTVMEIRYARRPKS